VAKRKVYLLKKLLHCMLNTKENMVLFYLLAPAEVHLHLMHHLDVHNVGQQTFKKSTECMYSTTRIESGELEIKWLVPFWNIPLNMELLRVKRRPAQSGFTMWRKNKFIRSKKTD
jgi:hypothetical protein